VYSLSLGIQIGAFQAGQSFLIDPALQKFFSIASSGSTQTIRTYSLNTLAQLDIDTFSGISGTADSLTRFAANGMAFRTSTGKVVFAFLVQGGDYNANATVDGADYVVWRNTFGQTGTGLPADGNGNSAIDSGDYNVWRAQFGQSIGSGTGANAIAAVPEPAIASMIIVVVFAIISRRRAAVS
jgi:hypothetical protein